MILVCWYKKEKNATHQCYCLIIDWSHDIIVNQWQFYQYVQIDLCLLTTLVLSRPGLLVATLFTIADEIIEHVDDESNLHKYPTTTVAITIISTRHTSCQPVQFRSKYVWLDGNFSMFIPRPLSVFSIENLTISLRLWIIFLLYWNKTF